MPLPKIEQDIGIIVLKEFFKNINNYIVEKEKELIKENPNLAKYVLQMSGVSSTKFGEQTLITGHGGSLLVYNTVSTALEKQNKKMPVISEDNIRSFAPSLNEREETKLNQTNVVVKYVNILAEKNMTIAQVLKTAVPANMPNAIEPYYMIGTLTYFLLERQYEMDDLKEKIDLKK